MARVRVFEAAPEGFRLIRREPLAVLVWSVVLMVIVALPTLLIMRGLAPMYGSLADQALGATPNPEEILALQGRMFAIMPITWICSLVGYTLAVGAALRAVLTPEDRKWFYLRFSAAEFWLALSALVLIVLSYIAMVVVMIVSLLILFVPLVIAGMASGGGEPGPAFVLLPLVGFVAVMLAMTWFGVRMSMGPLMSFDRRQFRLFESWSLTRGEGWRLFGLALLAWLLVIVVDVVIFAVIFSLGGIHLPNFTDQADVAAFSAEMMGLYAGPAMYVMMAIGFVTSGVFTALLVAPFARAYIMLRDGAVATEAAEIAA